MKQCQLSLVKNLSLFFLIFYSSYLLSISIGSDSSVLNQPFTVFQANQDNEIIGFTYMDEGFAFVDNATTCTFNSKFPVRGSVALNGGTLYLKRDMLLDNVATITSLGNIIALDNYALALSSRLTDVGLANDSNVAFQNLEVILNSNIVLHSPIEFQGECVISGQGNILDLGTTGSLIIGTDSHLTLKNIIIHNIHGSNIRCKDDSGILSLDDALMVLDSIYMFTQGAIQYKSNIEFVGSTTFQYTSVQTSTIYTQSQLAFTDNTYFCIGRDPLSGKTVLEFEDASATLRLDNCTFVVPQSGLELTKGTIVFDRNVNVDLQSTTSEGGVMLGNGIPGNDCIIYFSPAAFVSFNTGYLVFKNTASDTFKSFSQTANFFRKEDSHVYIANSLELPKVTIGVNSDSVQPIEVADGQTLTYKDTRITLPSVTFQITGQQYDPLTFLLNGPTDYLYITSGIYPLNLRVQSSANSLFGDGGVGGSITLEDSSASLDININGIVTGPITLNDGTINLLNDLILRQDEIIFGPGVIDLGLSILELPFNTTIWATPLQWSAQSGQITLNGPVSLSNTWTINGQVTINGQANSIDLLDGGEIVVGQNSQLTFRNIQISGLSDYNVRCLDNTGKIIFNDASLLQDGTYTFSLGSMEFINEIVFSGTQTFVYDSAYTSTIKSLSELKIASGATLNIGKSSPFAAEPLAFDDLSSILHFDNSSLYVKSNGLRLTKGTILLDRSVHLDIQSTASASGLILGNGGNPAYDVIWEHNPASTVNFGAGNFVYEGSTPYGITSTSRSARIVRGNNSALTANQNLLLSDFTIRTFAPTANLVTAPGKTFKVSNILLEVPKGTLQVQGQQIGNFTLRLNGTNDYANIIAGTLPLIMQVTGTSNTFAGSGNMSGPITLLDSSAILSANFNGIIFSSIAMNGGSLSLQDNLRLGNDASLTGSGCVDINSRNVTFGSNDFTWTGTTCWNSAGGSLNLLSTLSLKGTWTIRGTCIVNGNGNTLNLQSIGQIVIEPNSRIILRNIRLNNISNNSITCMDDSSSIVLDTVVWQQVDNVSFNKGALQFSNRVRMTGDNYTFAYQSAQTSTVSSKSSLVLDGNLTFSYDPIFVDSRSLFQFVDNTSELVLMGATLHATTTGLQLTKGLLTIPVTSFLSSEIPEEGNYDFGITIGNDSAVEDFTVAINGAAILTNKAGILAYRNVLDSSYLAENINSSLKINTGASLYLYQTLNLGLGILLLEDDATLGFASGTDIIGSLIPSGNFNRISI